MESIFELAGGERLVRRDDHRLRYELDGEPIEPGALLDMFGGEAIAWDVSSKKKLRLAQVVEA